MFSATKKETQKAAKRWRNHMSFARKKALKRQLRNLDEKEKKPLKKSRKQNQKECKHFYTLGEGRSGIRINRARLIRIFKDLMKKKGEEWKEVLEKKEDGEPLKHKYAEDFWDGLLAMVEAQFQLIVALLGKAAAHRLDTKINSRNGVRAMRKDLEFVQDVCRRMVPKD